MLCTSLIIFAPHLCFRFCLCKPNFLAAFHTAPGRSLLKSPKTWERCFFGTVIVSAYLSHLAASNQSSGSLSSLVLRKKSWHTVSRRCSTFLRLCLFSMIFLAPLSFPLYEKAMTGINCDGLATRFADREGQKRSCKT